MYIRNFLKFLQNFSFECNCLCPKTIQNKFHYAITGNTAAEIVYKRVDSKKENMGLTTWENSPDGKILKSDVIIAKNYLNEQEIKNLNNLVNLFLSSVITPL